VLQITLFPHDETFDEASGQFLPSTDGVVVHLEHSLVSLSKWECKWELPFLSTDDKTLEQTIDYIRMMIVGGELPPEVFQRITSDNINTINAYINSKQTATWFDNERKQTGPKEIITSELIYYWMIAHNIPVEFETWHLSRLLTLIKVCNIKNAPPDKVSPAEAARNRQALNAERKKLLGTTG
jgi:hypothetical protein